MKRRLTAVEARKRLGEILEGVYYRADEVVIERAGKPMAVVISATLYETIERNRDRLFELLEMNWQKNKEASLEDIEQDVKAAIHEMRSAP